MLSAVLKSETAVKMSIQIINAFVAMRRFIASNVLVFQRLDTLEIKQMETDKKMERVLNAIEKRSIKPKQEKVLGKNGLPSQSLKKTPSGLWKGLMGNE